MTTPPPRPPSGPPPGPPAGQPRSTGSTGPAGPSASTGAGRSEPEQPRRAVSVGQILAGILLVVVVVFVIENTDKVAVRLIFPKVHVPLAVALLIAAVLGALIAALMRYRRQRRHTRGQAKP